MVLQLLLSSFLISAQSINFFEVESTQPDIYQARVKLTPEQAVSMGDQLAVETPQGRCQVEVTQTFMTHFIVNTKQCGRTDIQTGTMISAIEPEQEVIPPDNVDDFYERKPFALFGEWQETEFFKTFIADRLSPYISYHASNTLEGEIPLGGNQYIDEISGAHTIGFGAEYKIADLPHLLSVSAGATYELPRSFGRFTVRQSNGAEVPVNFAKNPTLYVWNFYGNIRYEVNDEILAYMGMNYLLAEMKHIPGNVSGDLGVHFGMRYYAYNKLFIDGALNFYNLDYSYLGNTSDLSLTELEVKGGITF